MYLSENKPLTPEGEQSSSASRGADAGYSIEKSWAYVEASKMLRSKKVALIFPPLKANAATIFPCFSAAHVGVARSGQATDVAGAPYEL
jgi:hypothetical protein